MPLAGGLNQSSAIGRSTLQNNLTSIASPTKKIDSMLKFGDGYAKQIEKQKKVLEGLNTRIEEI